jgi:hypothetical protein
MVCWAAGVGFAALSLKTSSSYSPWPWPERTSLSSKHLIRIAHHIHNHNALQPSLQQSLQPFARGCFPTEGLRLPWKFAAWSKTKDPVSRGVGHVFAEKELEHVVGQVIVCLQTLLGLEKLRATARPSLVLWRLEKNDRYTTVPMSVCRIQHRSTH